MIRRYIFPSLFVLFACCLSLPGCGGGGEATYDPSEAPEVTQAELDEAENYMDSYEENMKQQGKTSPGN